MLVSSNTFRHPGLLAHEAMTVDHISNGRLELGLGAGWFVPEHEQFGIPLAAPGELVAPRLWDVDRHADRRAPVRGGHRPPWLGGARKPTRSYTVRSVSLATERALSAPIANS